MNENAKQWVAELRSGKWKQNRAYLAQGTGALPKPEDFSYCCLGVACELAIKAGVNVSRKEIVESRVNTGSPTTVVYYDHESASLPFAVQDWLGINSPVGKFLEPLTNLPQTDSLSHVKMTNLAVVNDYAPVGFPEIADIIESEPAGLFKP